MAFSWLRAFCLATTVLLVTSEYDEEVCSMVKESKGLVPPPLPRNFEFKGEHVFNRENYTIYTETYFDYTNSRGKYMYLQKGIEHHFLYDYETQQIVEWDVLHPGMDIKKDPLSHTCTAVAMDDSNDKFIFGYLDEFARNPKMYNSNEMLRFGGQYQYAFNGTAQMDHRGLLVDNFVGCVYDADMESTMAINYAFTNAIVLPSGGTTRKEVIGVDDGLLSVPVKAEIIGTIYNGNSLESSIVNTTENFFWFKGEPEFGLGTFKIPPYMYCSDYRGRKPMYTFPKAFSTRLQKTELARDIMGNMVTTDVTSFEEVWYDKERGLARRDYAPHPDLDSDIKSKFQNLSPVRTVFDFNEGIVYITNKPTGRCYARPITFGDFFEGSTRSMYIQMAKPEEMFFMQTDEMEYKGTDFTRDIECDVWAGKYFDKRFNATMIKETYISTNGWHEEADELLEFGVPVQHTMMNRALESQLVEFVSTYSFLKFKSSSPLLRQFDISNCIETIYHKDFALILRISNAVKDIIFQYRLHFLDAAQSYIAGASQVATPLRVQRMKLTDLSLSDKRTLLHFTLVDKANLKSKVPVGQSGSSLDEAVAMLQDFIDKNLFSIQFYPPGSETKTTVAALKGGLYIKSADGELKAPVSRKKPVGPSNDLDLQKTPRKQLSHSDDMELRKTHRKLVAPSDDLDFRKNLFSDTKKEEETKKKGMSSGGLTALAFAMLFIGIGIGVAIMYLYIRRYSEKKIDDRINLTPQASTSGVAETAQESSLGGAP